jgi:hypothetical protein
MPIATTSKTLMLVITQVASKKKRAALAYTLFDSAFPPGKRL